MEHASSPKNSAAMRRNLKNWDSNSVTNCSRWERLKSWPRSPNMALTGKTIVITRAASQSADLRNRLEDLGARVIECPSIQVVPPNSWKAVDEAIRKLRTYNWLLF